MNITYLKSVFPNHESYLRDLKLFKQEKFYTAIDKYYLQSIGFIFQKETGFFSENILMINYVNGRSLYSSRQISIAYNPYNIKPDLILEFDSWYFNSTNTDSVHHPVSVDEVYEVIAEYSKCDSTASVDSFGGV